jgi:hypothetical protein
MEEVARLRNRHPSPWPSMRRTGEERDHPTDQDNRCVDFRLFSVRYFRGGY